MNHPIAQMVALVCHGNAALRGLEHERYFPDNSSCQFCDRVEFAEVRRSLFGRLEETRVAATPDDWFDVLKREEAAGLSLDYVASADGPLEDRLSAGFVHGGGQWCMQVLADDSRYASWISQWEVWNEEAPENRIWRVTYSKLGEGIGGLPRTNAELVATSKQLRTALSDISSFAGKHGLVGFADCFDGALRILDTGHTADIYHQDLAPSGVLPPDAVTALAACQKAWVFGGMGSWNDIGFDGDDQTEYVRLSRALLHSLNAAIACAANSSLTG